MMAPNMPVDLWITLAPERTPKNSAVENIGDQKKKTRILDKFIHSRRGGRREFKDKIVRKPAI